jgi:hypothetical protein
LFALKVVALALVHLLKRRGKKFLLKLKIQLLSLGFSIHPSFEGKV